MSTSGYRAFTPPRIRLRAIPCTDLHQGFHFVTIRASEVGHSPPTVAPACPPAGGCTLCSGEPPPAASRSWPCATPAGGFAPAPSAMGRSGCSGATAARPPVASPPNGASGTARPPPCSRGPNAPGRAGAGRAAAPTGYLPIGRSAAAATFCMARNAAVTIMIIFMMLIPLCLDTRTSDRVPKASSSAGCRLHQAICREREPGKSLCNSPRTRCADGSRSRVRQVIIRLPRLGGG